MLMILAAGAAWLAGAMVMNTAKPAMAQAPGNEPIKIRLPGDQFRLPVPEFPKDFKWINTEKGLSIPQDLKGHVVILDFWTYCCINCIHILPRLKEIEHKYKDKPVVVIGVHSAKFNTEKDAENIRQAVGRYRMEHPVIVDQEMKIWNALGVNSWPTLAFIDTKGRMVFRQPGELETEVIDAAVAALLEEGQKNGTLAKEPVKIKRTDLLPPPDSLAYPGKVIADGGAGGRLFIADSARDRIIVTDLSGKFLQMIGSGKNGLKDGTLQSAEFRGPQGMALAGDILYVADTENHAVRKVDLKAGQVTTLAGNGKRGGDRFGGAGGAKQELASPWDLAFHDGKLYIAMAGTHQLWVHDPKDGSFTAWAGSGRETIIDAVGTLAALSQPSGLAVHDGWLYFADSEVSAVRRAKLGNAQVETLIGTGLFDFGYKDGAWKTALLQHCLGVAVLNGNIVVADTYNDAIRLLDLKEKTIKTIYGGPGKGLIDEPTGLCVLNGIIYIADTNLHRIVKLDPATGKGEPLAIKVPLNLAVPPATPVSPAPATPAAPPSAPTKPAPTTPPAPK